MKKRFILPAAFAAAIALVGGLLAAPSSADVLFVSDVSASVTAPASSQGGFSAVGTITNSGTINQPAGSKLSFSVTGGSISSAPGCSLAGGVATCTVGALSPGQGASVAVGVTPAPGATSVVTQAVVQAAQLESDILDTTNNTATAATAMAYAVDAALVNQPTDVLYGDDTLLSATVTNTKAPQTVNAVIASGGVIDTRIAVPVGCAITDAGTDLTCSFALATNESRTFDVAVAVPTSGSSIVSTLTATGATGGTKSVSVTTTTSSSAQAFVPEGDSLSYQGSNQFTNFKVPVGSTAGGGTFLLLTERNLTGVNCGAKPCIKQAAEAIFPSAGKYSGQDPNNPYVWDIKYNERQVCNGNGNGCLIDMYWIATGETQAQPMQLCPTWNSTQAPRLNNIDDPCLQKVTKTQAGYATYTVAVLRDIVIPIISSTTR